MEKASYIELLKTEMETTLGRKLNTPTDFAYAAEMIEGRIHEHLSHSTLMRLWGYINENITTRATTLNIISRYVGYLDFETFKSHIDNRRECESEIIIGERINSEDLNVGKRIEFCWQPGRRCVAEYQGKGRFKVIEIENSKIKSGSTFTSQFFIVKQPLHLFDLQNGEEFVQTYVVGKNNGLTSLKTLN